MKEKDNSPYFILSSNCKMVDGAKRLGLIDYQRGNMYFFPKEYFLLLKNINRKRLSSITNMLYDTESKKQFNLFLTKMRAYELCFLTDSLEYFPEKSDEFYDTELIPLFDVIFEIQPESLNLSIFKTACNDLDSLRCKDFQLRFFSNFNAKLLNQLVEIIDSTCANYIEIHCNYHDEIDLENELIDFINKHSLVTNIFLYGAPSYRKIPVFNEIPDRQKIILGNIYFVNYNFDYGDCCGIINMENLTFSSVNVYNRLKKRNGCLDRKITIDRNGNIKNCPSMQNSYGNIRSVSIVDVIQREDFQRFWFINKDQINVCKVCEFRYCCTDCRAFLQDSNDIYSKPLKCGYDPYTCKWEEWSNSPLKEKELQIVI